MATDLHDLAVPALKRGVAAMSAFIVRDEHGAQHHGVAASDHFATMV